MYYALMGFLTPESNELPAFTIGGVQSGTLPIGIYTVESDIVVLEGTILTLTAGSIFRMKNRVLWEIQGRLIANGSVSNRITFEKDAGATLWHGIRFCKEAITATGSLTVNTSTDVITTGFTLNQDWPISFTTTGVLPSPLKPNQRYYIRADGSLALNMEGDKIDITDSGSGTHTSNRLNPTSSSGLRSSDYQEAMEMTYCDIIDADKSSLPSSYSSAFRHWLRGGGLMTYECEDMTFDNLRFYRCKTQDRGGGAYIQGLTATAVPISFNFWLLEDCECTDWVGAGFSSSHGQASVSLSDFTFDNCVSAVSGNWAFTADATTNRINITLLPEAIEEDVVIKELATSGTLPDPLAGSTVYFAVDRSGTACGLALTPEGTPIDILDAGSGSHTLTYAAEFYCFDTTLNLSNITVL